MKFLKQNKYTVILVIVFFILVLAGYEAKKVLSPDEKKAEYGNRLESLEEVKLTETDLNNKISDLKKNNNVKNITIRCQGKIVRTIITVVDNLSIDNAKKLADSLLTKFDDKYKNVYSFEFLITKEDPKQNNFPIDGMKDPLSKNIIWTKDRDIVKSE